MQHLEVIRDTLPVILLLSPPQSWRTNDALIDIGFTCYTLSWTCHVHAPPISLPYFCLFPPGLGIIWPFLHTLILCRKKTTLNLRFLPCEILCIFYHAMSTSPLWHTKATEEAAWMCSITPLHSHFPLLFILTTPVLTHQGTRERTAALRKWIVSTTADTAAVDFYASFFLACMVKHDAVE